MKIAFFSGNMEHGGGTEKVLSLVANGLSDRGYEVMIFSLTGKGPTYYELRDDIKLYWIGSRTLKSDIISNLRKLSRIMKDEKPDFLIDVDIILGFYSVLLKARFPKTHWISWEHFNYFAKFEINSGLRKLVRLIVSLFSECLVVLSDEDKGYYRDNMSLRCRLTRIYNPTPVEEDSTAGISSALTDDTAYIPKKNVLAVGGLIRRKGYDMLLPSWRAVEKKHPDWTLTIVGDGEEKDNLYAEAERLGIKNVVFAGQVKDVGKYYRNADFFVLSSRDEGFAMVLLEAMGYGLPIVAFNCKAGVSEAVEDGVNGYLVQPGNIKALARKMDIMITDADKCRIMGRNSIEKVKRFGLGKVLDEWEALLNSFPSSYLS